MYLQGLGCSDCQRLGFQGFGDLSLPINNPDRRNYKFFEGSPMP